MLWSSSVGADVGADPLWLYCSSSPVLVVSSCVLVLTLLSIRCCKAASSLVPDVSYCAGPSLETLAIMFAVNPKKKITKRFGELLKKMSFAG